MVAFTALFIPLSFFSFLSADNSWQLFLAKLAWSGVIAYFGFCIYRYNTISRYRSILFISIAFFFFLEFKLFRLFSFAKVIPPYCHIAQAPTILSFIHSQFLAFASGNWQIWGPLTLGFLWLLIMFTIGQGICSWVCFYGGIDEACSKLRKKPLLKINISKKWRDFPLAFLVFLLIISFLQGLPVFCNWFCPFKLTTGFWDSQPAIRIAQIAFFLLFLAVFVVLLPILSKKRVFCSLVCPFGALVSICGKLSPYRVVINKSKCTSCGKCFDACPSFAVDKEFKEYRISCYCNKCAKCIDICPEGAINITAYPGLATLNLNKKSGLKIEVKDIFIFLSLLLTGALSGYFVPRAILQLIGLK